MIYLVGNKAKAIEPHLNSGVVGLMNTPANGYVIEPGWAWAADNGCFGKGWPGYGKWIAWLEKFTTEQRAACLFATAPDVVGDGQASLARSLPWLAVIRSLGYPAALVTQDGMTPSQIPWQEVDWLFIGGTDDHKLGPEGKALIAAAHDHGKRVHIGRVNSQQRFLAMAALGADSCDGTFIAFGPETNVPRLMGWIEHERSHEPLFSLTRMETA